MADLYADENISWDAGLDGFEPWELDDDHEPEPAGRCAYCGTAEVRENPDPYGGKPCCEACFSILIGDSEVTDGN